MKKEGRKGEEEVKEQGNIYTYEGEKEKGGGKKRERRKEEEEGQKEQTAVLLRV